jgi:hypothetical protein
LVQYRSRLPSRTNARARSANASASCQSSRSSYRGARAELASLRARVPDDEAALAATVEAVELALDRERWIWMAIMSVAALTTFGRRTDR